ncbi:MAG: alcohol dehydrogenase catalytic domain-containing protein [Firmicutes bacterium]|nr:alcohol dehydrogenase catalytic domain-containing protein [Bacillota bacterium]
MKAWRVFEPGKVRLESLPAREAEGRLVKVKITYSVLSETDRLIYTGKLTPAVLPLTLGRQAVGMVSETGSEVQSVTRGDRVVIDPYIYCGACAPCKDGRVSECVELKMYGVQEDGFLSDFALVSADHLFKLPDRVKDTDAIFAGHIAAAMNIISKLSLQKGEHLVIVGASVIGITLAQAALYYQAIPILVDARQDRLDIAENLGVYYCVNSVNEDVHKKIFALTGGNMAEAVCYIDGSLARSLEFAATGGRVAIFGWRGTKTELSAAFSPIFSKQLSVFGVCNGAKLMPAAINMLANKTVSVAPLVSTEAPFKSAGELLTQSVEHPNLYIKALVKM